jgi:hypothetical protein
MLRTSAQQNRTASHSLMPIFKTIANTKVINAAINSIRKFFSDLKQYFIPCHA